MCGVSFDIAHYFTYNLLLYLWRFFGQTLDILTIETNLESHSEYTLNKLIFNTLTGFNNTWRVFYSECCRFLSSLFHWRIFCWIRFCRWSVGNNGRLLLSASANYFL